jgi:hypothetical protein
MTQYDLKVDGSSLTTTGIQLTLLSPAASDGPTLGLISMLESTSNLGNGVCVFNAAIVYLTRATIKKIHARVNDGGGSRHVSVQFSVSPMGLLSDFAHSYST